MENFLQDVRYSLRQLRKSPGFALTAILILMLGIGASTAIFGFVDAALIKPLPYSNPKRLVEVTGSVSVLPRANLSYPDYLDWKRLNHVFTSMDVYDQTGYLLRTSSGTEPVEAVRVSDGFFRTLGVAPVLGRDFHTGEDLPEAPQTVILSYATWQKRFRSEAVRVSDGFFRTLGVAPVLGRDFHTGEDLPEAPQTVILSYATWQKRYGGRKDVVGETVNLSDAPYTIVGVLPETFQFAAAGATELWTNLHPVDNCSKRRSCHSLTGIGRLKDGVSVEASLAEMKTIAKQLEIQYPNDNRGQGAYVAPLTDEFVRDIRPILLALLGGAGLLLLIACVNVSSLLLVRSESRKREIAVRGALGASRIRLAQQFTIEGLAIAGVSGILGLALAQGAMQVLTSLISKDMMVGMPYLSGLGLNLHVLAFAAAVSLGATILFSMAPIFRLPLGEIREGLAEGGRGSAGTLWRRFGANLVVVELAVAVVLLVSAGLLGKSFYRLLHVEIGFQPDHLDSVTVALSNTAFAKDEQQVVMGRQIIDRVSRLPGVQSAGLTSVLPVSYNGNTTWIRIVGKPYNGEHYEVNQRDVSSAFFSTIRAKLLRGRYFTDAEDATKPHVMIINRALADKYFPGEDPIGQRIGNTDLSPQSVYEVIGVVENVRDGSLESEIWPAVYYPFNQSPDTYFNLVVRTSQAEQSLLPTIVTAVRGISPAL